MSLLLSFLLATAAAADVTLDACTVHERRVVGGEGPRLVLFNGVPVTSSVYDGLVDALAEAGTSWTLAQVDLPGTGLSTLPHRYDTWDTPQACVRQYLERHPGSVVLVHDASGPVVLPLLADPSLGLAGAVVLNTMVRPDGFRPPGPMQLIRGPGGRLFAALTPRPLYRREVRHLGLGSPDAVPRSTLDRLYAEALGQGRRQELVTFMRSFRLDAAWEATVVAGLETDLPQLVIWGTDDPVFGRYYATVAQPEAPHPRRTTHVLAGGRHFFMLDHAALVAGFVSPWLEALGSPEAPIPE